jgi:hypothetical protein
MTEVTFHSLDDIHAALDAPSGKEVLDGANQLAQKYGIRLEVVVVAETS